MSRNLSNPKRLIQFFILSLFAFITINKGYAQSNPMEFYGSMKVKNKSSIDKSKSFFVICDSVVRKYEIPEQIRIIEDYLKDFGFQFIKNTQIDSILNLSTDSYYRSNNLASVDTKGPSNADINSKTKIESFYVLSYSIAQIKDVGIDKYLMQIIIYEKDSKKIVVSGEVENSHGRIRSKFEKYVRDFFDMM